MKFVTVLFSLVCVGFASAQWELEEIKPIDDIEPRPTYFRPTNPAPSPPLPTWDIVKPTWDIIIKPTNKPPVMPPVQPPTNDDCETFVWPQRLSELIVAEVLTSSNYGTTDPAANALQFCEEEGYQSVGNTVGDVNCEHTGGDDNDESRCASWNGNDWCMHPTP